MARSARFAEIACLCTETFELIEHSRGAIENALARSEAKDLVASSTATFTLAMFCSRERPYGLFLTSNFGS